MKMVAWALMAYNASVKWHQVIFSVHCGILQLMTGAPTFGTLNLGNKINESKIKGPNCKGSQWHP